MIATKTRRPAPFFTTCQRCGYIVSGEEEICEACQKQKTGNPVFNLFLW
ncbi:MAG: hypothetical protein WC753_00310 [Candidatus Gracilibacteria bacterium]